MEKLQLKPKSRTKDIVIKRLDDEVLIYDLNSDRALCLNQASALVWEACDGENTVSEIAKRVSQRLGSPINDDFVWLAVNRLSQKDLIANRDALPRDVKGVSRREVLKSLGSSMIALPIVTSIVAPTSADGQSCGACQCSGLLTPVSVCPPGFAQCPPGCPSCVIAPGGCVQGEGTIFCNGTCQLIGT